MGLTLRFNCKNCFYQEMHDVGFGFKVRKEIVLYVCNNCEVLTSTNAKTPRCRKCRSRRLIEVDYDIHVAKCPECKHEGVLEESGSWD